MKSAPDTDDARELKTHALDFVRKFGFLVTKQTPCGQPFSPSYAHALMVLREREIQGLVTSQADLAERLGLDKSSIARLCARLEADGRATQRPGAEDARTRELELSARGRKLAETTELASLERFRRVMAGVPRSKRATVLESLQLLTRAVAALEEESA